MLLKQHNLQSNDLHHGNRNTHGSHEEHAYSTAKSKVLNYVLKSVDVKYNDVLYKNIVLIELLFSRLNSLH